MHYVYSCGALQSRTGAGRRRGAPGTEGLRSLTHVRVDERAGLPKGSTSNHFRTRAALLEGVLEWMLDTELPEVGAATAPETVDELVEAWSLSMAS